MSQRIKKKKKIGSKPEQPKKQPPQSEKPLLESRDLNENKFDFGGIPDRDLKKNLGCG